LGPDDYQWWPSPSGNNKKLARVRFGRLSLDRSKVFRREINEEERPRTSFAGRHGGVCVVDARGLD
jgi:hypothetical protein